MPKSDCPIVIDSAGQRIRFDEFISDPNVSSIYTDLSRCGICSRSMLQLGFDIRMIIHVLSVCGAFISGQKNEDGEILCGSSTRRWKFVHFWDTVFFVLGIEDLVIIQDTGDMVEVLEGGYSCVYQVLYSDVSKAKGQLLYSSVPFGYGDVGSRPQGTSVVHINDMTTIDDEDRETLVRRDVHVAMIPGRVPLWSDVL